MTQLKIRKSPQRLQETNNLFLGTMVIFFFCHKLYDLVCRYAFSVMKFVPFSPGFSNVRTCRASLRKPKREQYELPKRSGTPLTRSAARKSRLAFSFLRQVNFK